MRRLLVLSAMLACSRELTLPPLAQPPRVDSVAPAAGFAGDFVTLTGANLKDPAIQVFFDVRTAAIVTPPEKRDGRTLVVQVPQDVLSTDVSVTTPQGTAKSAEPFTYLGLGHPRTVALRANVDLTPTYGGVFPLTGGEKSAIVDERFGTVFTREASGFTDDPLKVGNHPLLAFGPTAAAWVASYENSPNGLVATLQQIDFSGSTPVAGARVTATLASDPDTTDGAPGGGFYAAPNGASVRVWTLPAGTFQDIDLPGTTDSVKAVRFADDSTIVGITGNEPFIVTLGGGVQVGAPFPDDAAPDFYPIVAIGPGVFAYTSDPQVRWVTWSAGGAPALSASACSTQLPGVGTLAVAGGGSTVLVGDVENEVVGACDVASGKLISAQPMPGLRRLAAVSEGDEAGFALAATSGSVALLFPDGRLLRTEDVSMQVGSMAVDPACGDVLVATSFGPLRIARETLQVSAIDVSLHLSLSAGEGGLAAWSGHDLYAYVPAAGCASNGAFQHVATAASFIDTAALSGDGKWAATSDGETLELLPREDSGLNQPPLSHDYGSRDRVQLSYAGDQLTTAHPLPAGYAITTYAPGTLDEIGSMPVPERIDHLKRLRFAQAWMVDSSKLDAAGFNIVATEVLVWAAGQGVLTTAEVPASVTIPSGVSADGFMLAGFSNGSGMDTLLLQISQDRLIQESGPHVDLATPPTSDALPSPDGGRFYVSLATSVAVIE